MVNLDRRLVEQKQQALEDRRKAFRAAHAEAMQRSYRALIASQALLRKSERLLPTTPHS